MKKLFFIALIFAVQTAAFAQRKKTLDCGGLVEESKIPFVFGVMDTLKPDPCGARPPYNYWRVLTISPEEGYIIHKKKVVIQTETTVDSDCNVDVVEIARDTIITGSDVIMGEETGITVGGKYVVQCELMLEAPSNRPKGFMATLLPDGNKYAGYWVVHYGEYDTSAEAQKALRYLKTEYQPEFCSAFIRRLPQGCEFRFEYR